jgi:hypothetical protein
MQRTYRLKLVAVTLQVFRLAVVHCQDRCALGETFSFIIGPTGDDDAERTVRAGLDSSAPLRGSRRAPESRLRSVLALRPAWWWSATSVAGVRCGSMRWSGIRQTLPPASSLWPSLGRSSSPAPRAGCSAIGSACATSAGTRSRVLPSRSQRGRSRACRLPRALRGGPRG